MSSSNRGKPFTTETGSDVAWAAQRRRILAKHGLLDEDEDEDD